MFCKSCGKPIDDSFNVCPECGTKKGEGNAFCSQCGAAVNPGMAFCEECGNKIDAPAAAAPAAPAAQPQAAQVPPPKKYCRNCGKEVQLNQAICTACGVKVGEGNSFCPHCAAPVANADAIACTSCGRSLKPPFDFGKYMTQFANNFTGIFKDPGFPGLIFDYGPYFLGVLGFLFALLPCVYTKVDATWSTPDYYFSNLFSNTGFGGFLVVIAFLFSIARFVPHVYDFIRDNQKIGKFAIFVVPGLHLIATIILLFNTVIVSIFALLFNQGTSYYGITTTHGLFVFGWLFMLMTIAEVVVSVMSMLRKNGKLKI